MRRVALPLPRVSLTVSRPSCPPPRRDRGPLEPQSLYGAGKLAAEVSSLVYVYTFGLKVHIFRFANIIGPNMTHSILPDFFEKLRRDPTRLEILGRWSPIEKLPAYRRLR